jgi:hypothetical protein
VIDGRSMPLIDARTSAPDLDKEGFPLVRHASAVSDITDQAQIADVHAEEIIALLKAETGADVVIVSGPRILRFREKSDEAGAHNNSMPGRFAHIDASAETSKGFVQRSQPEGAKVRRYAHYNVWRSFSGLPQDVPLALGDARSAGNDDLLIADALSDKDGRPRRAELAKKKAGAPLGAPSLAILSNYRLMPDCFPQSGISHFILETAFLDTSSGDIRPFSKCVQLFPADLRIDLAISGEGAEAAIG